MSSWKTSSISGSSPEVGSSSTSSSTSEANAATSATFWPVLRAGAAAPGRVELEPLQELVAPRRIEAAAQAREQVDRLASGEVRPQVHLARHVGEPPVQRHRVAPGVTAEQAGLTGVGSEEAEQDADRSRLPRAVRPQEARTHPPRRRARGRRAPSSRRRSSRARRPRSPVVMVGPSPMSLVSPGSTLFRRRTSRFALAIAQLATVMG